MVRTMANVRVIRVFIASPGDLAIERLAFKGVVEALNAGFSDGAGVTFEALGWEDQLAMTGRRSQSVINADIDRSDVFVLALYGRWGRAAPDAAPYTSYTEEEFHRALTRWKAEGAPEIFVFFKNVTVRELGDPGEQLQKVLAFRRSLESSRAVLYKSFADEKEFAMNVDRHLRAYAKGEVPQCDIRPDAVLLPLAFIAQVELAQVEARKEAERADAQHQQAEAANARAEMLALELAERAAKAALEGRVEEAAQTFAKAHQGTLNAKVIVLACEFYQRTGDLDAADELLGRWLAIMGGSPRTVETADVFRRLGLNAYTRGDLGRAEEMHGQALNIAVDLNDKASESRAYGNLGLIYRTRGDLRSAEEMFQQALSIARACSDEEGEGRCYGNLGLVYRARGEFDQAEQMHRDALAIATRRGNQQSMATQFGNLGLVFRMRADPQELETSLHLFGNPTAHSTFSATQLELAKEMFEKALAIHVKLGRQEGIAIQFGNLGLVYQSQNDFVRAEEMHVKALAINQRLGRQEGVATQFCNLGLIYQLRGDLDRAEEMHAKALHIDEQLKSMDGMARQHGNLGVVYEKRREWDRALQAYTEAHALYVKAGLLRSAEQVQDLMRRLEEVRSE